MSDLDCRQLVELVTDYLEDRLPAGEVERFEAHIAECPGCHHHLEQIRTVMRLGAEERAVQLPALAEQLLPAFRTYRRGLA